MIPFINISSGISIPTFYLVISLVTLVSIFWLIRRVSSMDLDRNLALDLSLIIMICGFLGARAMHILFENFDYYKANPSAIFYFWQGGFVFYGGAFLSAFVGTIFLRVKSENLVNDYLDLFAPVLSLTYGLGRFACLLTGCCYGKFCTLPWAIDARHPTQAYAILWEVSVVGILLGIEFISPKKRWPLSLQKKGGIFYSWLILHGSGRILMEHFRDDFRGPQYGLSISAWLSLLIILIGLHWHWKKSQ